MNKDFCYYCGQWKDSDCFIEEYYGDGVISCCSAEKCYNKAVKELKAEQQEELYGSLEELEREVLS